MTTNLSIFIRTGRLAAGWWFVTFMLLCVAGVRAAEPAFTNVTPLVAPGLPGTYEPSAGWGDYDNDGRPDLLFTAFFHTIFPNGGSTTLRPHIFRNTESGFVDVTATVAPGLPAFASAAWADYDNDGRLDFLIARPCQLWRNTGSGFENVTASVAPGLLGSSGMSVAWGDYDNDGRPDFLLTGHTYINNGSTWIASSQVWRNTASGFTNVTATVAPGLPGVSRGSMVWGDYDNDGRLDFLLTGMTRHDAVPQEDGVYDIDAVSQLWRNTGSGFVNVTASATPGLPAVYDSAVAWGDYDNDGRLDFLLTGSSYSQLWRNMGGKFTNVTASLAPGLPAVDRSAVAWGDYDNDGRLDFLLSGVSSTGRISQLWRSAGTGFTNATATAVPGLPAVNAGSVSWGDYDNDGRPDFFLTGAAGGFCDGCDMPLETAQIWRNNTAPTSPPPVVMTFMPASANPTNITLSGAIDPNGQSMTAWFIWGHRPSYDYVTPAQPMGNGNSFTNFSQTITGWVSGWLYYRAAASNEQGHIFLGPEEHTYLTAPYAGTVSAQNVTASSATLNGHVWPQRNNHPTYSWFEWGIAPAYDRVTPAQFVGFPGAFAENISGLDPGNAYFFRAVVSNGFGVSYGVIQPFYTPSTNETACSGYVSPVTRMHGYGGGFHYPVYFRADCDWNAINTNSWITITSATSGVPGSVHMTYNLAVNTDPQPRTGSIIVSDQVFWLTQAAGHPVIVTHPTNQSVSGGGTASFSVAVAGSSPVTYQWQFNGIDLVDGDGISGSATSNLVFAAAQPAHAGAYRVVASYPGGSIYSRWATLAVSCNFTLAASSASFGSLSATGLVEFAATPATCAWSIVNTNPWVTILSSIDNMGDGTVRYALAANPAAIARSGNIRIADKTFTITQAAGPSPNAPISLAEALDTEGVLLWGTVGSPTWFGQPFISQDGVDALQSGPIAAGGAVTVETTVHGPGTITFRWKVSSKAEKNYLKFFINDAQQLRISGEADWEKQTFALPSGPSELKWTYSKNYYGIAGQDRGWLDQVQFVPSNPCNIGLMPAGVTHDSTFSTGIVSISTSPDCVWTAVNTNEWVAIVSHTMGSGNGVIDYLLAENTGATRSGNIIVGDQVFTITQLAPPASPRVPLAEALDTVGASLAWDTIGTPVWFGQTSVSRHGGDAAQSGAVGHNAAVTMHTTVEGPGIISYWWKVSSEPDKDLLKFFVDGVQQSRISGQVDWELRNHTLPAGEHLLKWTYSKNASNSVGLDRGWVDQVRFLPDPNACSLTLSPISAIHSSNYETGIVNVAVAPGCAWNVVNTNWWLSISQIAGAGDGNGFVRYSLSVNYAATDRTGVLLIGGLPYTILQRAYTPPCSYSLSPNTRSHDASGATDAVSLSTQLGCVWNVFNTNAWITIESGLHNSSSGQVIYSVSSNATGLARSGNIQIAGYLFTVSQSAVAIPLAEALDTVGTPILWETGLSPWTGQGIVTHDGVDAARSGNSSGSALRAGFNGPGTLTFWWKVSSTTNNHTLRLRVNATEYSRISGEVDWQQRSVTLPAGYHLLEWSYNKVGVTIAGQDRGWVDEVQFVPGTNANCGIALSTNSRTHGPAFGTNIVSVTTGVGCPWVVSETNSWITILSALTNWGNGTMIYQLTPNTSSQARTGFVHIAGQVFTIEQEGISVTNGMITLPEALDTADTPLIWNTSGLLPWFGQEAVSHDGVDAAQSGAIPNSATSSLDTTVNGPGMLIFWWKVSSETNNDTLRLFINGVEQARVSGEVNWQQRNFAVPAGSQVLEWRYGKNAVNAFGQDAGWVDQVEFSSSTIPCTVSISPTNRMHGYSSTANIVNVAAQSGCPWNLVNTNSWISILSSSNQSGSGTITYSLTANTNIQARTGRIIIGGRNFFVTQSGGPSLQFIGRTTTNATVSVQGDGGKMYVVQFSEDLIHWIPISTNSAASTATDATAGNVPRRFYRTVEIP